MQHPPSENGAVNSFNYSKSLAKPMAAKRPGVMLVEASTDRIVVDTKVGRVIVESDEVRFHRSGRGRGRVLLARERSR